jgi:hypothetical protein
LKIQLRTAYFTYGCYFTADLDIFVSLIKPGEHCRLVLVEGMDAYARMKSAFDKENIPELVARVSQLFSPTLYIKGQ